MKYNAIHNKLNLNKMKLLEATSIGNLRLKNRMVMAPMTRARADNKGIAGPLTVLYYKQRSTAGLIISEGINISEQGKGSPLTPGIYNAAQVEAWQKVTDAVHETGVEFLPSFGIRDVWGIR